LQFTKALRTNPSKAAGNPTIFAWHGSSFANWHSIVRSGLDYTRIACGRAYGNGVYFSRHFDTSRSYSSYSAGGWPNSDLQGICCMSLNEIINSPQNFVSSNPHYVVAQLDWHQCRYLFVQTKSASVQPGPGQIYQAQQPTGLPAASFDDELKSLDPKKNPRSYHKQPPGFEIIGMQSKVLQIPLGAVPSRTRDLQQEKAETWNKRPYHEFEDSEDEDSNDIARAFSDIDNTAVTDRASFSLGSDRSKLKTGPSAAQPLTPVHTGSLPGGFVPGALDLSTLPRIAPPSWATPAATKTLAREVKMLQNIQATSSLNELGWYIDFDQMSNLFQWIVELHSFDQSLPLAKDMRAAGVSSIVLEIRFGKSFPFSPPFVRVIRPKFTPFMEGGGGHVTLGGAMCMVSSVLPLCCFLLHCLLLRCFILSPVLDSKTEYRH
jgi:ubiquitin-conjugating enzyme E2 Q